MADNKLVKLTEEQFKKIILGVVNTEPLLEYYARIGYFGRKNEFEVYIRTDDPGYIPHFHVMDSATQGKNFDACIELSTNKYFSHGGHVDTLNSRQRKALAEFMESPCDKYFENNYERTVYEWNSNNSNMNVEYTGEIPNYREINSN